MKLQEGSLTFDFPSNWEVARSDQWSWYRNQFQRVCGGSKAVDFAVIDDSRQVWLIEVKDYRQFARTKVLDLAEEFGLKVRDTIAGLMTAATNDPHARVIEMAKISIVKWTVS